MNDTTEKPDIHLVTLLHGSVKFLLNLLCGSSWSNNPKDKIAGGRLAVKLEDIVLTEPDAPETDPRTDPDFRTKRKAYDEAAKAWARTAVVVEMSKRERAAAVACVKKFSTQETGVDRFTTDLLEKFDVTE